MAARAQGPSAPSLVAVAPVAERELPATIRLVGTVEPATRSLLGAEVAGLVKAMPVRQGDLVGKGKLICQLKDDTLRLDYREAVARLDRLKARLTELEAGERKLVLVRLQAAMEEARALYEKWRVEKERIDKLYESDKAAYMEYRDVTAEFNAAAKRFEQAKALYELGKEGPRAEVITQARFDVAAQEAAVARFADYLSKTTIEAPFSGHVADRHTEVGEWIDQGGAVVELVDLRTVLVRVNVPEAAIPFARVGATCNVRIDALGGDFEGKIKHVIPQADQAARTFPVEIEIANSQFTLKAGMFARADVPSAPATKRLTVPTDAIIQRGPARLVFVIEASQGKPMALPVPVHIEAEFGETAAVKAAPALGEAAAAMSHLLRAGAQVVVQGNQMLFGPSPVMVLPTTMPAGPTTRPSPSYSPRPDAAGKAPGTHPAGAS